MVKAAVFEGPGRLGLQDFPRPRIGASDGLLRIEAAGICGSDVSNYLGKLPSRVLPRILGHEILGNIEEVGEEASRRWGVKPGDRVFAESTLNCGQCFYCRSGQDHHCPQRVNYGTTIACTQPPHLWGAYAQFMYLDPRVKLHKVPRDMSVEAAVLVNAVLGNGIEWVINQGGAGVGSSVVIQGCGGQGLAGVIAAKEAGAQPIIVTGLAADEKRLALAREFGADHAINVEAQDVVKAVAELTEGRMADVVLEVTSSTKGIVQSIELARPLGTVVLASIVGEATSIFTNRLQGRGIRLQGVHTNPITASLTALKIAQSRKYPVEKMVTHRFPLEEVSRAMQVAARQVPGEDPIKVILLPWS